MQRLMQPSAPRGAPVSWPGALLYSVPVTAAYVVLAELGLSLASVGSQVSLLWAPSGLALGVFLLLGGRLWPAVFLGSVIANHLTGSPLPVCLAIAAGNSGASAAAAAWLRHRGFRPGLDNLRGMVRFVVQGALPAAAMAATVGTAALVLGGQLPGEILDTAWAVWFMGDLTGILLVTPLLLAISIEPLAGMRSEPPPSPPWATGTARAATRAAEPPEEPPAVCSRLQGLWVGPRHSFSVVPMMASSGRLVLARKTRPAWRRRLMATDSWSGTKPSRKRVEAVKGTPATKPSKSLTTIGTPRKGPSGRLPRAAARACSSMRCTTACRRGST